MLSMLAKTMPTGHLAGLILLFGNRNGYIV